MYQLQLAHLMNPLKILPSQTVSAFGFLLLLTVALPTSAVPAQDTGVEFFERKIRPLLVEACIDCHGPDEQSGKLRLDSKAGWKRGGERGPAIVTGDPAASLLYQAVTNRDEGLRMPPADHADPLTEAQIRDLEIWIRAGAPDPRQGRAVRPIDLKAKDHWAFQPLPTRPKDQVFNSQNPVDFFINARLKAANLRPLPPADPRTLIRRATYDLIGLPPTAEQIQLGQSGLDRLVEQLLSSPHYGERWGRHWLDVARYSDAKDGVLMYGNARIRPFAYTYRDYVIKAFNEDLPFSDFIRHQLAADQLDLPSDSPYLAAMGFLTLGRMFDNNRHDVIDDQIDVTTRGFLGLTASCARCHDHKFDPIPTADYYSLYGVFASTIEPLDRPRISPVQPAGKAFETELKGKLAEIERVRQNHYRKILRTAREKTKEYLVHVATTKPDFAETAIFFKSLTVDQLRPRIVHRWRKLIARRAHAQDPLFAPWHDLHQRHLLERQAKTATSGDEKPQPQQDIRQMAKRWRSIGVDPRLVSALVQADPKSPASIAEVYGDTIVSAWESETQLRKQQREIQNKIELIRNNRRDLADIVAGGNGTGTGINGQAIHPATGRAVSGQTGFLKVKQHDVFQSVAENPLVDGVFIPKSGRVQISSTKLLIEDLPVTSGQSWDFFKAGPSNGSTENRIDQVDYSVAPNSVLAMHANKGITFDLNAIRGGSARSGTFTAVLGNSGAKGQSLIDFFVYVDGQRRVEIKDFAAQGPGHRIKIELTVSDRFLTLVATEGKQGISHDQVILGNPHIKFANTELTPQQTAEVRQLEQDKRQITKRLAAIENDEHDPLKELLDSKTSPVWFPAEELYYYLSRGDKDSFRGLLNQVDAIAVKHNQAADRAMVLTDRKQLYDPVIFQRGDPGQKGNAVPRKFLQLLDPSNRPFRHGSGRLELANAIASDLNPLTARVWVNRIWMHHFGEPLVSDPSDFGLQSNKPVQLELLDFLASSLISNGWKTKPLHRMIMSSQTYQRSSIIPPEAQQLATDPDNQLYWRFNRRRLDLEQMRDSILFIAGNLDRKMFGRPGLITDPGNRRRTIYAFVERQNLPDIIQTFDFANADSSTARRPDTIVPQQALFAMNSRFMQQQVAGLVDQLDSTARLEKQVEELYRLVFLRSANSEELPPSREFAKQHGIANLAHVLLMTNEFMFVD